MKNCDQKSLTKFEECDDSPTPKAQSEVFLTEQQLAQRWNISRKKLQADRWKGGGVPYCKFGRAVRFKLSDVLAFESANTHRHTSDGGCDHA